jgi:hypothetical protein
MTTTLIRNADVGGKPNTSIPRQNFWAERRAWWRRESARCGTDWPSILKLMHEAVTARMEVAR